MRAVLALTKAETKYANMAPCIRCGFCLNVCPEKLNPYVLLKFIQANRKEDAVLNGLTKCSSCGACAYVCLSRIPLIRIFDNVKEHKRKYE
jgi:electron transport complex protein RnfC